MNDEEELVNDCLVAQWDFLEWLDDEGCLSEKGKNLKQNYWTKFIEL